MQVIIYKFVDGTTNAVEVTEDIYLIHLELYNKKSATIGKKQGGIPRFTTLPIWE